MTKATSPLISVFNMDPAAEKVGATAPPVLVAVDPEPVVGATGAGVEAAPDALADEAAAMDEAPEAFADDACADEAMDVLAADDMPDAELDERTPLQKPLLQVLKAHCWLLVHWAWKLPQMVWSPELVE